MTISPLMARVLVDEHAYKEFPEEVHLLGKQTILLDLPTLRDMFKDKGLQYVDVEAEYDDSTIESYRRKASVSDVSFFETFGVKRVRAIDHSDFEGADIVFDLTRTVPDEHIGTVGLIFDGSVLDNIFDPASAIQNVARLLKPGGRYIGTNMGTTRWFPAYVAFNPYWYFDYFVVNGFRDVKIYVVDHGDGYSRDDVASKASLYLLDANADHRNIHQYPVGLGPTSMIIIAEKDDDSTSDERTSQGVYRLPEEWEVFDRNIIRIQASNRPIMSFRKLPDVKHPPAGFKYVGTISSTGANGRHPREVFSMASGGEMNFGDAFPGWDWGPVGRNGDRRWRWVGEHSVALIGMAPGKHEVEAIVHTARDIASINELKISVNGKTVSHRIQYDGPVPVARFQVEATVIPTKLGFEIPDDGNGQRVALSEFRHKIV